MTIARHTIDSQDSALRDALTDAVLPIDDLDDKGRVFFRFTDDGTPIGYGGYEPHGDHALIRSIVVLPRTRGHGHGRVITTQLMDEAKCGGARDAFLLTNTAEAFFQHLGFTSIARADAPAEILATTQASSICSTAPLMRLTLGGA